MKLIINFTEIMCVTTHRNPLINQHFLIYIRQISDETNNYTLLISLPIEGNASDPNDPNQGFYYNNRMPFSTGDKASSVNGSDCANGRYQFG